jgi:hypothetical protein
LTPDELITMHQDQTGGQSQTRRPEIAACGQTFASLDRRDAWILSLIAVLFVVSRVVWLRWNLDSASYWEESYRWIAAHEILNGPIQPLLDYQADNYQGGSLAMILFIVALFRLFGESVLLMKLVAVLMSTTTLIVLYVLGRKVFGRAVAVISGVGYLAGPPLVAYWGLVVMGSHCESALFSLLQLLIFSGILAGRWRSPLGWCAFGFVSGLGLWFCFTSGLSLAACALSWVMLKGIPRVRELLAVAAGTLVGLIPWFVYNAYHDFAGVTRLLEILGMGSPTDCWLPQGRLEKLVDLIRWDFAAGLVFPDGNALPAVWLRNTILLAFAVPLALALAFAAQRSSRILLSMLSRTLTTEAASDGSCHARELVFMVYAAVWLAFFLGSPFTITPEQEIAAYRLFLPPAVLLLIPAAHTVSHAIPLGYGARRMAIAGMILCLASSATGTILLASRTPNAMHRINATMGYFTRGVLLHRAFEHELSRAFEAARRTTDPDLRFNVVAGIALGILTPFRKDGDLELLARQVESLPMAERVPTLVGLRFFGGAQRRYLQKQLAAGEDGPYYRTTIERLTRLQQFTDDAWGQVPAADRPHGKQQNK